MHRTKLAFKMIYLITIIYTNKFFFCNNKYKLFTISRIYTILIFTKIMLIIKNHLYKISDKNFHLHL